MPNRTIYIADAVLPIFEKAQKLAGNNLSSTIAQALRYFVEKDAIPEELYTSIAQYLGGEDVEILDI